LSRQVELGHEATDSDYLTFQRTVNANVKSGAKTRQQILSEGYGMTTGLAHEVLVIALTSTSRPVLVDAAGEIRRIPRRRLALIVVWAAGEDSVQEQRLFQPPPSSQGR